MGVGGQHHARAALPPGERPCTHCTGGWVGPRAGLDVCGKSRLPTGIRFPDRPARSLVAKGNVLENNFYKSRQTQINLFIHIKSYYWATSFRRISAIIHAPLS
jgi:hypothetical protein